MEERAKEGERVRCVYTHDDLRCDTIWSRTMLSMYTNILCSEVGSEQ